ncbi:AAA family ATPase, partial [Rhizobium sp. Root1220]|uniref:AAA family ATPase n=1 Tax=Rhizobium sp. Root1220 TaxID=1736432 RepID=UPI001FCDC7D1
MIIFTQEGSVVHEDFELAATLFDKLAVCDVRHLRALSVFRRCGELTEEQAAVIAEQPSQRMEAIFRRDQPASRAATKLLKAAKVGSGNERLLDVTKGFGEASVWADALKRDLKDWRQGKLPWAEALLFLDEFDAIGDRAKFPSRHELYSTTVVNALLECLDGTEGREGVIVLGACNYPERIDPALLRSGRLEKHVRFPLPDVTARGEILEFHLPHLAGDAALKEIGARLPGKSGADLERMAREARRIARKETRDVNIQDVRSQVQVPPPLDAKTLYRVAIHEAGHALVTHA